VCLFPNNFILFQTFICIILEARALATPVLGWYLEIAIIMDYSLHFTPYFHIFFFVINYFKIVLNG